MEKIENNITSKYGWVVNFCIYTVVMIILLFNAYSVYFLCTYNRIEDNKNININGIPQNKFLKLDTEYTVVTYNVGYGAFVPEYTCFWDGGEYSWAISKESVIDNIEGIIKVLKKQNADIIMLQEVDFNSTRSYHVDEVKKIGEAFRNRARTLAINYNSPYLFYPIYCPYGVVKSGLLTLSDVEIKSATRKSLPLSNDISKTFDLDRCYSINRINVKNGKELVVINVHTSAYSECSNLRTEQLIKIFNDMKKEYEKGNYVICAGDFNHDFVVNSKEFFNNGKIKDLTWNKNFPDSIVPKNFKKLEDYTGGMKVTSCRDCDKPYSEDSYKLIVDGFIVSDNVEPTYMNVVDTQFKYSDHNPVKLKFKLR